MVSAPLAKTCLLAGVCALLVNLPASASEAQASAEAPLQTLSALLDPGGYRTKLETAGVKYQFTYYGDAFENPIGGARQGPGYDGRIGFIFDADLEKLVHWSGAVFHASVHDIQGTQFSAVNVNSLMQASSVEAHPSLRLFNLWVEQQLNPQVSLRVGQITAAQEFLASDGANLFVNATFGWPQLAMSDLPSGGPAYPEATPGARIAFAPNDRFTLRAAIFNGNPAGPGQGDPIRRDPNGVVFRLTDAPLAMGELDWSYGDDSGPTGGNPNQEGFGPTQMGRFSAKDSLPGAIKLGAWLHAGTFADERAIAQSMILGAPSKAPGHTADAALYGVFDQMLWRGGGRNLGAFLRLSVAPGDRNLVDRYLDAGLTCTGLLDHRPNDVAGLAVAVARISSDAVSADRSAYAALGTPVPIYPFEMALELSYRIALADRFYLQPNIQYIVHPSGNLADLARQGAAPAANALVLGLRTVIKF